MLLPVEGKAAPTRSGNSHFPGFFAARPLALVVDGVQ